MLMANNKMYENYLMHYRTPGSKNGYTKYPGKYTPVGEKAQYIDDEYRKNLEYNSRKNNYSTTTTPSSNSSNIYKSNSPTTFTYDSNSGKTVPTNRPLTKREQLAYNTRASQVNSVTRSKLGPLKSALFDSAIGGFYDKRTGKSWDTESMARAAIDPRYKQELQDNSAFSLKRQIKNSAAGQIGADIADRAKRGASNAKDFGGFMAKDIASRAKSVAKKGRDFTDFVVEDNIDRAKKLVGKGKKKVSKLLKKFF